MSKYSVEYHHAAPAKHSLTESQTRAKLKWKLSELFKGREVEVILPKPAPIHTVVEFKL